MIEDWKRVVYRFSLPGFEEMVAGIGRFFGGPFFTITLKEFPDSKDETIGCFKTVAWCLEDVGALWS